MIRGINNDLSAPEEFSLGAPIVPARNGLLNDLGHDVALLGKKALGIVVESKEAQCLVQFPELKLSLWLSKNEIADIPFRSFQGDLVYQKLWQDLKSPQERKSPNLCLPWIRDLVRRLQATHVLNIEKALFKDLWTEELLRGTNRLHNNPLSSFIEKEVLLLSLGIPELYISDAIEIENDLGPRLISVGYFPAGMHKIEARFLLDL